MSWFQSGTKDLPSNERFESPESLQIAEKVVIRPHLGLILRHNQPYRRSPDQRSEGEVCLADLSAICSQQRRYSEECL